MKKYPLSLDCGILATHAHQVRTFQKWGICATLSNLGAGWGVLVLSCFLWAIIENKAFLDLWRVLFWGGQMIRGQGLSWLSD